MITEYVIKIKNSWELSVWYDDTCIGTVKECSHQMIGGPKDIEARIIYPAHLNVGIFHSVYDAANAIINLHGLATITKEEKT